MSDEWGDLPEPSEEELAEAAALQVALDRGHDDGGAAEDALEAAHLLAFSAGGELSKESADAVLGDVLKNARRPELEPKKSWWRVLVPVSLLGAATAAILLTMQSPVVIPAPSLGILQAQAAAAAGSDPAGLDEAMGDYREDLYAALEGTGR